MTKANILPYFLGLILLSACKSKVEPEEVGPPNILFILSDDHTSQAWGLYGGNSTGLCTE